MSNPYFNSNIKVVTDQPIVTVPAPVPSAEADPVEEQEDFKQYEDGVKHETVRGLTSIIIPVWFNSYPIFHYTGNCIGSIREHTNKLETSYEIILVVQGNTGINIKPEESYVDKVIELEENLGFSRAVNKGIRAAFGEYIAIVNNDVQVFDYWLSDMRNALNWLDLVMATPMYGKPFARALEAKELRDATQPSLEGSRNVNYDPNITDSFDDFRDFSCVLTRKALFDQIGLFDEQFMVYGEDLDLLKRMDQAGLKYASTKRVNTTHIIGGTSSNNPETPRIMDESRAKLEEKWKDNES